MPVDHPYRNQPYAIAKPEHPLDKKANNARELGLDYELEQPQTENILYLLSAWERGAYAEEYANEIEALRQAIKEPDVTLTDEGKTWQGLTDEEIDSIESGISRVTFVRAIEARLKELNA